MDSIDNTYVNALDKFSKLGINADDESSNEFIAKKNQSPKARFKVVQNWAHGKKIDELQDKEAITELRRLCKWGKSKQLSKHKDFNYLMGKCVLKFGLSHELQGVRATKDEWDNVQTSSICSVLRKALKCFRLSELPASRYHVAYLSAKLLHKLDKKQDGDEKEKIKKSISKNFKAAKDAGYDKSEPIGYSVVRSYSTLIVGDGDFSFSLALSKNKSLTECQATIASVYDSYEEEVSCKQYLGRLCLASKKWIPSAFHNIKSLEKRGVCVRYRIDATRLHEQLPNELFQKIHFNMPYGQASKEKHKAILENETLNKNEQREKCIEANEKATHQLVYNFWQSCLQNEVLGSKGAIVMLFDRTNEWLKKTYGVTSTSIARKGLTFSTNRPDLNYFRRSSRSGGDLSKFESINLEVILRRQAESLT